MREIALIFDGMDLDRTLPLEIAAHRLGYRRQHAVPDLRFARQLLRARDLRHGGPMREALLFHMEGDRHGEDRMAVLDGAHAPRRKAPTVAQALDLVNDRYRRIARQDEISVERV